MEITRDCVVTLHYRLTKADGEFIEESHGGDPILYLQGRRGVLPAIGEALLGKQPGDEFSITLQPGQAYGTRQPNAQQRVPRKHILTGGKLKVGQRVKLNTEKGPRDVCVAKVGLKTVDIDTNHPLAGEALTFDLQVVAVREATAEELAHGHAHGVGGHQH